MYNLGAYMNGDVQEMLDALKMQETAEKLQEGSGL
jgi:peptide chain release factor 1